MTDSRDTTSPPDGPAGPAAEPPLPPLAGVRVVDLTTFLSGPFCTQILGDLGADILKIESPGGDSSRAIPPHFLGPDSVYYLANNRNKRSVCLDLKSPRGLDLVRRLISLSDVVVENYRPGVCERLGLDVPAIRRAQPGLVWASISGFGQYGPRHEQPAYDMIVQALSGVMSLTGEPDGPSVRLGIPAGDLVAGMYTAIGIAAALVGREAKGEGKTLDVSMLDSQLTMLSYQAAYSIFSGTTPPRQGSSHDSIPTYRKFDGGDGREFVVTANTERMWRSMCEIVGHAELADDERFADGTRRLRNRESLWALLEAALSERPAAEWVELLVDGGVPAALIKTAPEALAEAAEGGRNMVVNLQAPDGRAVSVLGNPIIYSPAADVDARFPPVKGEHTEEVLVTELGLERAELDELRDEGVIAGPVGGADPGPEGAPGTGTAGGLRLHAN